MLTIQRDWSISDWPSAVALARELLVFEHLPSEPYWRAVALEPLAGLLWVASRDRGRDVPWLMELAKLAPLGADAVTQSSAWELAISALRAAGLTHPADRLHDDAGLAASQIDSLLRTVFAAAEQLAWYAGVSLCA